MQTTSHLLMIRPAGFGFNPETATSNAFQQHLPVYASEVQANAIREFDTMTSLLEKAGIHLIVINDTPEPHTPDAIFPNNWISFHENGDIYLYPMQAESRRKERRKDIPNLLKQEGFTVRQIIDLSDYEQQGKFLEGTGSMVLDRNHKIAYACISPRTNQEVLEIFCRNAGYTFTAFNAQDRNGTAIYHTNVLMGIGESFAVICADALPDEKERSSVLGMLQDTGKEIILLTFEQMLRFAGNMLQICDNKGGQYIIMSDQALRSLAPLQADRLSAHGTIIAPVLTTIETSGGGSARCMIAEIFLPYAGRETGSALPVQ